MADTFSNDLRVRLQESGSNAGSWGDLLNGTITNIASGFGQGSEAIPNASTHTITLADGTADEARSLYLKLTGGGQACTVTLGPNTISKVWIIDNATSYTLTFSQGSGANVAIAAGAVKVIATDGAGSGAAVVDTLDGLEGSLSALTVSGALTVDTNTLVVDATNNRVGIGNSSPPEMLTIGSTSDTNVRIQFLSSTTGGNTIHFGDGTSADAYRGWINYTHSDDALAFATGGSEAMRISGGNLLVSKTSDDNSTAGVVLRDTGEGSFVASGQRSGLFNRLSSDGEIVNFRKDGTTVGSIGNNVNNLTINGLNSVELKQGGTTRAYVYSSGFHPWNDATYSLGLSNSRWSDLYLSGGAYLGGTAAANKLDHYEDVAWTPTQSGVTLTITKARALRVGNLVTLNARITWPSNSDGSTIALGGLPFPYVSTWEGTGSIMADNAVLDGDRTQLNTYLGGSSINFYKTGSGVQWVALNNTALSGAEVIFTVSYLTS